VSKRGEKTRGTWGKRVLLGEGIGSFILDFKKMNHQAAGKKRIRTYSRREEKRFSTNGKRAPDWGRIKKGSLRKVESWPKNSERKRKEVA